MWTCPPPLSFFSCTPPPHPTRTHARTRPYANALLARVVVGGLSFALWTCNPCTAVLPFAHGAPFLAEPRLNLFARKPICPYSMLCPQAQAAAGRATLVHCGGGKGRAGTVLACYLCKQVIGGPQGVGVGGWGWGVSGKGRCGAQLCRCRAGQRARGGGACLCGRRGVSGLWSLVGQGGWEWAIDAPFGATIRFLSPMLPSTLFFTPARPPLPAGGAWAPPSPPAALLPVPLVPAPPPRQLLRPCPRCPRTRRSG